MQRVKYTNYLTPTTYEDSAKNVSTACMYCSLSSQHGRWLEFSNLIHFAPGIFSWYAAMTKSCAMSYAPFIVSVGTSTVWRRSMIVHPSSILQREAGRESCE